MNSIRLICVSGGVFGAIVGVALAWPRPTPTEKAPASSPAKRGKTVIREPAPPTVATGRRDRNGKEVRVACSVCHTTRPPNPKNTAAELNEFHQGLNFAHGRVGCLSCHDANDYDQLHHADGRPIAFQNVMTLCGQCHGPQHRDYRHGAHGGMRGHWDLSRGDRSRNTCTDCHDPHAPAYPQVQPVFPPAPDVRHD